MPEEHRYERRATNDEIPIKTYIDSELKAVRELLKVYIDDIHKVMDKYQDSTNQRFLDGERAVGTAFDAAKEAVIKSETGVEKRSDAVYVTIGKLQESLSVVMPRAEAEQRFAAQSEKVDFLKASRDTSEGQAKGSDVTIGKIYAAVGFAATLLGLIVLLANGVFGR